MPDTPVERARSLRSESTKAERLLWGALRGRRLGGWKWRRQVPKGPYIVDFLCADARLIVELDGGHHAERQAYDEHRTQHLEADGYRVLRFWNDVVLRELDGVCDAILRACGSPPHLPFADANGPLLSPADARERG